MFKHILVAILSASQCYGMENENKITVERINTNEELQLGLDLSFKSFDVLYQKADDLDQRQKEILEQQRKIRLQQLLSISERNDVFVKENNEIIGFLASRLAPDISKLVIFDNAFLGKPEKASLVYQSLLDYVQKTYSKADKIWFALLKTKATDELARKYNFEKSKYLDSFHRENEDVWQGWERKVIN